VDLPEGVLWARAEDPTLPGIGARKAIYGAGWALQKRLPAADDAPALRQLAADLAPWDVSIETFFSPLASAVAAALAAAAPGRGGRRRRTGARRRPPPRPGEEAGAAAPGEEAGAAAPGGEVSEAEEQVLPEVDMRLPDSSDDEMRLYDGESVRRRLFATPLPRRRPEDWRPTE